MKNIQPLLLLLAITAGSAIIFLFFSYRPDVVPPEKIKKIAVRTFTGDGGHDEIINWFYIKNVADTGFSGYYLESTSKVTNFKQSQFFYSKIRPPKFEAQYASGEKVQLFDPKDLPDNILNDSSVLESVYQ